MKVKMFIIVALGALLVSCIKAEAKTPAEDKHTARGSDASNTESATQNTEKAATGSELVVLHLPKEGVRFPIGWKDTGVELDENLQEKPIYDETGVTIITEGFLDYSYAIGKYEVTYGLWKQVYDWATMGAGKEKGYVFGKGEQGHPGMVDAYNKKLSNPAVRKTMFACGIQEPDDTHPVSGISWYDCIVWCNAYSEMTGTVPAYYKKEIADEAGKVKAAHIKTYEQFVLRDASDQAACDSLVTVTAEAVGVSGKGNGFRLPTYLEWVLAAKLTDKEGFIVKRDDEPLSCTVNGKQWFFTKGTAVSGGKYNVEKMNMAKAILQDANQYAHMPSFETTARPTPFSTFAVGSLRPNALGIYDMSGNVAEWCMDCIPAKKGRVKRCIQGGAYNEQLSASPHGAKGESYPGKTFLNGLRICRTE